MKKNKKILWLILVNLIFFIFYELNATGSTGFGSTTTTTTTKSSSSLNSNKNNSETYDDALRYYNNGEYDKAATIFLRLAKDNYSSAQEFIGYMYEYGLGVKQNYVEAKKWYEAGIKNGSSYCKKNLAILYYFGRGVQIDYKKAYELFYEASLAGEEEAMYFLGLMYFEGYYVTINKKLALEYFTKAANKDFYKAMEYLGYMYEYGDGVELNYDKAVEWYKKAINFNSNYAYYRLGKIYYDGKYGKSNVTLGKEYIKKAADLGNENAKSELAKMDSGTYTTYNSDEDRYKKAIDLYDRKDYYEAFKIFKDLADNKGHDDAQNYVAIMYEEGRGTSKDLDKAVQYYTKSANKGNKYAQYNLGLMGYKKIGKFDYKDALKWFTVAAEQNFDIAQYYLGLMYYHGKGTAIDKSKAFELFLKAAYNNNVQAQEFIGYMYEFGDGVAKDYNKAKEWYEEAIINNSGYAYKRLGIMYSEGKGVTVNKAKAYDYFKKAIENGESDAKQYMNDLVENYSYDLNFESIDNSDNHEDLEGPKIILDYSKIPKSTSLSKIKISGQALDPSGVAIVNINGKEAALDDNGNFLAEVLLKVGDNYITIQAVDIHENKTEEKLIITRSSQKIDVTENEKNIQTSSEAKLSNWYQKQYAMIIGINNYQNSNIPNLINAENDAKTMIEIFKKSGYEVTYLLGSNATKKNIIKELRNLKDKIKPNDSFLFYFAGHGQALQTIQNNNKYGYIIPYDAEIDLNKGDVMEYEEETISLDQLKKYINDIPAKHIALLLDSCFSGLVMEKRALTRPNKKGNEINEYYEALLNSKAINILTAGDDQPVSDGSDHSPFARAIILALDKGNVDIEDGDGYATFSEFAVYVKKKVENITNRKQRPQFDNFSVEDGDYLFKVKFNK